LLRVLLFRGHAVPAEAGLLLIALSWMTQKVERHLGRDCRNGRDAAPSSGDERLLLFAHSESARVLFELRSVGM